MPVQINAPNFSGTAALAANGGGNLNLSVPGNLGLQGLQLRQAQQQAQQKAALERMQILQQGDIAFGQQRNQRNELAQQGMYQQGLLANAAQQMQQQQYNQDRTFQQQEGQNAAELDYKNRALAQQGALGQGGLDVQKQQLIQEQQAKMIAKLLDEDKEKLKQKGNFAAYGIAAMEQAKSPEEAQLVRTEILKSAKDNGYLTDAQVKLLGKTPLSQFTNFMKQQAFTLGEVGKIKEAFDANDKKKSSMGTQIEFNEDGSIKSISQDPTKAIETEAGKNLVGAEKSLQEIARLRSDFKEKYFTNKGRVTNWTAKLAEENKGMPLAEQVTEGLAAFATGKDKEGRAKDIREQTKYLNGVEQFFFDFQHKISGAAVAKDEVARLKEAYVNGKLSPSEMLGALDQIFVKTLGESEFNKNILNKGLDTTPKDKPLSEMTTEELQQELKKLENK